MTDNDNAVAVHDNVNHPVHYQGSVECIDAIMSATESLDGNESFLVGSVIKYIWRYRKKGKPVEDLKKARWYLDKLYSYVVQKEGKVDY